MMNRIMQLLLGSALAVALAIYIYPTPTQLGQRFHAFNLMEERPRTLSAQPSLPYGIFYFVQQWPKTYCLNRTDCRNPIPNSNFTIHGLWPQSPNGSPPSPSDCCPHKAPNCKFNWTSIRHLVRDLDRVWPNLRQGSNRTFWEYEWYKHGSCSLPNVPQVDYFNATIKLYDNFSLFTILKGFITSGKDYPIANIKNTIQQKTTLKVLIWCRPSNATADYVSEIVLCVNPNANGFQNCNGYYDRDKCGKNVKFP